MMTFDDLNKFMEDTFELEVMTTRAAGQKEYAHSDNAFDNFERLAAQLDLSREQILWVFATKHADGIASWIRGHKSQREDVTGRIKDLIVYLFLLWGMIHEDRETERLKMPPPPPQWALQPPTVRTISSLWEKQKEEAYLWEKQQAAAAGKEPR